jgi:hypothetical protein
MNAKMVLGLALILTLLGSHPTRSFAAAGTVQLTTGDPLKGEISIPPKDTITVVLADSREKATVPIEDIEKIEVADARPDVSSNVPFLKRIWRRFIGPAEKKQTVTVTLRSGEVFRGWLSWQQSDGVVEVRPSKYIVRKAYLKPKQADRDRRQPIDVTKQYIRSITFSETDSAVPKGCAKCGKSFEVQGYRYCPFDGTALTEAGVSVQN